MIIITLFVASLGLVFGSFLYTMSIRLRNQESIWRRSACRHCRREVSVLGLIPLIGYTIYRGRCGACGEKIPAVYPLMELANALLVTLIFWKTGPHPEFFHAFLIFECLFLVAILDFQTYFIFPQPIVVALIIQVGWFFIIPGQPVLDHLLGLFLGAGIFHWVSYLYQLVRKRNGLGDGDAILLGLIGFIFGWGFLLSTIFWGALFGIIGGGGSQIIMKQSLGKEVAFGPWLSLAAFCIWLFPEIFQSLPFDTTMMRLF